jgi:sulfonate transport system permease protein
VASRFAGLLVPVAAIALWQLLVATGVLDYEYLPSPLGVGHALADLAASGDLAADLANTLGVAVLAALIAVILGGATGLAVGLAPAVGAYLMTSVDFLRTIPAVALLPVVVLSFGTGVETELILAVYAAQCPVLLNCRY